MVRLGRLITIAAAACAAAPSLAWHVDSGLAYDAQRRWAEDQIREEAQADIMRRAPELRRDPDLEEIRRAFAGPNRTPQRRSELPLGALREIEVFAQREAMIGDLADLLAMALHYEAHIHPSVDRTDTVSLSSGNHDLESLVRQLEREGNVYMDVLHEAEVVMVRPRPRITDEDTPGEVTHGD